MVIWLIAALAGALAAAIQYGPSTFTARALPLAALRGCSVALVVALLLGGPAGPARAIAPDIALDASESWMRASDSVAWKTAVDSALRLGGSRVRRFGDSLRVDASHSAPRDHASRLRGVVDAATGAGRPAVVITDGELDEPELLSALPRGSRIVVVPRKSGPDLAVAELDAPRALLAGDTVQAHVTLVAGAVGSAAGSVELRLDDVRLDSVPVPALHEFAERVVTLHGIAGGAERTGVLRVIVHAGGDMEPRNDSLAMGVDVTRAPAAVFISTAPDFDAREAVAALRGVTSLPTRAYYRVAPGLWRTDAALAHVDEKSVRDAARDAPMVVLHGDTSVFGKPREATHGALLLFAPPTGDEGEWFPASAPVSPIAPALGGVALDSLAPIAVSASLPRAEWQGLLTHRGGAADDRRVALVGWESPRRIAVLGASGFWRWRFRGGVRADAYSALFGALYDWLAAGRTDRRAVVPDGAPVRAGMPLSWRRGAPTDSSATVVMKRRGAPSRSDTLVVRFANGASVAASGGLPQGIYDVTANGGASVVAINASRELVPRRITVKSGEVGGEVSIGEAPLLRDWAWVYAIVVILLCAEWLLRRRVGLR
ncbi:MAG: hypothetical protein ABJE47_04010 [bacterium]